MSPSLLSMTGSIPGLRASTWVYVKCQVFALSIVVAAAACTRYQAPDGPEAAAVLARYNGTWLLDADASDPVPEVTASPVVIEGIVCSGSGSADDWSCRQPDPERTLADSTRALIRSTIANARPERLTLEFTDQALHISGTGPGSPLTLPLDSSDQTLDHPFGDIELTAWVSWDELAPVVEFSIEDGGWVSDRYEIVPDGTLTVTRSTGHYVTPAEPLARFVYARADAPPS